MSFANHARDRLLAVPPTFFLISLLVFALVGLAPGAPIAAAESADAQSHAATKAFRSQFDLDKPVLLNTRWWTSEDTVASWLTDLSGPDARTARARLDQQGTDLLVHLHTLRDDPRVGAEARDELCRHTDCAVFDPQDKSIALAVHDLFLDTRFAHWWRRLLHGDLGTSMLDRRPVAEAIAVRLPYTLALTSTSLTLALALALPVGLYSAEHPDTHADRALTTLTAILVALPSFFLGTVLLGFLSQGTPLQWFPSGGLHSRHLMDAPLLTRWLDMAWHLVLPIATYTLGSLAVLSRYVRAGAIEVVSADFVRTARALGTEESDIRWRHVARNGLLPLLTLLGGLLPALFGGSVIIEIIFSLPGMGRYLFDAISMRDHNVVLAILLTSALLTQLGILLSDLLCALADPRIRLD